MTGEQETPAGLAAAPVTQLEQILQWVPRLLSSKGHIMLLGGLLVYLVILPLLHVYTPSSSIMLIGGNWTNVTSDMGACVAAGGTVHLVRQARKRSRIEEERLRLARETHQLLHFVHAESAAKLNGMIDSGSKEES